VRTQRPHRPPPHRKVGAKAAGAKLETFVNAGRTEKKRKKSQERDAKERRGDRRKINCNEGWTGKKQGKRHKSWKEKITNALFPKKTPIRHAGIKGKRTRERKIKIENGPRVLKGSRVTPHAMAVRK